jgi:hypothetical protein
MSGFYAPEGSLKEITASDAASASGERSIAAQGWDEYVICFTADIHYRTGPTGGAATTSDPLIPAGVGRKIRPKRDADTHLFVRCLSGAGSGHKVYHYPATRQD